MLFAFIAKGKPEPPLILLTNHRIPKPENSERIRKASRGANPSPPSPLPRRDVQD